MTPPSRIRWTAATAIVALVCLPAAAAREATPQATFQAASASWFTQTPDGTGEFVALRSRLNLADADTPIQDSSFEIQGVNITVESDVSNLYLDAPGAVYYPGSVNQSAQTYTDAIIRGQASRTDRFLYVFPLDGGIRQTILSCAGASVSREPTITAASRINTRKNVVADSSTALLIAACPGSTLTLKGSFLVVLWEWDCHLAANEGEAALWSGKAKQEAVPDLRPYASRAQQLYITVHDGSFTILGNAERSPALFMQSVSLTGASQVNLNDASGHVDLDDLSVQGHRIEASGNLDAGLTRSSDEVAMRVDDGLTGLQVDGRPIPVSGSIVVVGSSQAWGLWLMLAGLVVAAAGCTTAYAWNRRWRSVEVALGRVFPLLEQGRGRKAVRCCDRLLRRHPGNGVVLATRAYVLSDLNRHDEALQDHERVHASREARDPEFAINNCLQAAYTSLLVGRKEDSLHWLEAAQGVHEGMFYAKLMEPHWDILRQLALRRQNVSGYS